MSRTHFYDMKLPAVYRKTLSKSMDADFSKTWRDPSMPSHPERGFCAVVNRRSPRSLRHATFTIAQFFRREFGYDFVQYEIDPSREHERDRAFLWAGSHPGHGDEMIVGAAVFRWRHRDPAPHYALSWVWFHPYERRQGHLSAVWSYFRQRFGEFHVEGPLSQAMRAFLAKHGNSNPE